MQAKQLLQGVEGKKLRKEINEKDEQGYTSLHYGCYNGSVQLVKILLYYEANLNAENSLQQTPLIVAAERGFHEIVVVLITAGAEINHIDKYLNSALHYAAMKGNIGVVDVLLQKASINLSLRNVENKLASELAASKEIKAMFENTAQKRKNQNSKKVQIFHVKQKTVTKMFKAPQNSKQTSNQSANKNQQSLPQHQQQLQYQQQQQQKQLTKQIQTHNLEKKKISKKLNPPPENKELKNLSHEQCNQTTLSTQNISYSEQQQSQVASLNRQPIVEKVGPKNFTIHGIIGKGSFGEVYLVEHLKSQKLYAMKTLHKSKVMRNNLVKYAMTERNVLSITNHPFIVKLKYAFQTTDKLFLILHFCPGGDLGEHLQIEKKFTEDRVRIYLAEIILALEDLHKRDIIFRDLKPDNIVLDMEGHALLTDFGLSKEGVLDHFQGAGSFCGSVAYLAPEMIKRCGHGKAVDWYLLGVIMYELLVGIPPYFTPNREELFQNIQKAPLKLPNYLSTDAKSLLKALLQRNPAKRLGSGKGDAEEIKQHAFFKSINWETTFQKKLKPPKPQRTLKICTKFNENIFQQQSIVDQDKEYIPGWSFANQN